MREDIQFMQRIVDNMVGIEKFSYPARQDAPKPKGKFCAIDLIEEHTIGTPNERVSVIYDSNGKAVGLHYDYRTAVQLRFRLYFFRTTEGEEHKVTTGWTTNASKAMMIKYGYGYLSSKHISLETEQLEKQWNPRHGLSILVSTERRHSENVCLVETVEEIKGCYFPKGEKNPVEVTFNVTQP